MDTSKLKPGDEVAFNTVSYGTRYVIRKVAKISPAGRITLDDGMVFNPDGWERGVSRDTFYHAKWLCEVDDRVRENVREVKAAQRLDLLLSNRLGWPAAKMEAVAAAVEAYDAANPATQDRDS